MSNVKEIDLNKVYELAKIGLSEEQIGVSLGISRSTISRRKRDDDTFATALKEGKQAGVTTVTNALFESATAEKPNTSAQIFFLKNRGGWRDKMELDQQLSADITLDIDIEQALEALRDAGIEPDNL
tara:strand:- start:141 stop:521 length:381 start_codon:yes stop_codon:yes gene_type:complete